MFHILSVFVLPLISLLAGVASIYIDPKTQPQKKWILVALMLLSAAGAVVGGYNDDQTKSVEDKKQEELLDTVHNLSKTTNSTESMTCVLVENLSKTGLPPAMASLIQQSCSAEAARAAILPTVKSEATGNVTVAYYPKNVDGPVVINALKEGGFKVETRAGNPANGSLPTNAIWIGDSVTVEQAKFVALTLVRAGVAIESIRRGFRESSAANKSLIEIGVDQSLLTLRPMTVDQINALKVIPSSAANFGDLSN